MATPVRIMISALMITNIVFMIKAVSVVALFDTAEQMIESSEYTAVRKVNTSISFLISFIKNIIFFVSIYSNRISFLFI